MSMGLPGANARRSPLRCSRCSAPMIGRATTVHLHSGPLSTPSSHGISDRPPSQANHHRPGVRDCGSRIVYDRLERRTLMRATLFGMTALLVIGVTARFLLPLHG